MTGGAGVFVVVGEQRHAQRLGQRHVKRVVGGEVMPECQRSSLVGLHRVAHQRQVGEVLEQSPLSCRSVAPRPGDTCGGSIRIRYEDVEMHLPRILGIGPPRRSLIRPAVCVECENKLALRMFRDQ